MDRLSELGTARGFAKQDVDRAKRDLARAEAEYAARDLAYRREASISTHLSANKMKETDEQ